VQLAHGRKHIHKQLNFLGDCILKLFRLNPEIDYHVGNIKWATWKDRHGDADIQMPVFYTLRVYTSVTVMRDRPCLVAALSPKNDEGVTDPTRKVMVFAKCDVVIPAR